MTRETGQTKSNYLKEKVCNEDKNINNVNI